MKIVAPSDNTFFYLRSQDDTVSHFVQFSLIFFVHIFSEVV